MKSSDSRRAKITDEHRAEAAKLKAIWDATPHLPSQGEFGHRYGIGSQGAVSSFLNGRSALSPKAAAGFAAGLGRPVSEFSPRLAGQLQRIAGIAPPIGTASSPAIAPAPRRGDAENLRALSLLVSAYERADQLTLAQVHPLFSMLFGGASRGALDAGTIAQRLAELLPPPATAQVQGQTHSSKASDLEATLDIEDDKDGPGDSAENRERAAGSR